MLKNIQFIGITVAALACSSCEKSKQTTGSVPSTFTAAEDTKVTHTNAAVDSLYTPGIDNVDYIYNRYISWVKHEDGPTGKEVVIFGVGKLTNVDRDLKKIDKVIQMDAYPKLSEQAKNYKKAYEMIHPILAEANQYYKREDYKDDDFKKGRELHQTLISAFNEYFTVKAEYRDFLADIQDQTMLAELEKAKSEGRAIEFETKSAFRLCDEIWLIASKKNSQTISLEKIETKHELLIKTIEKHKSLVEALESKEKTKLTNYISGLENMEIATIKLIRNLKSKENTEGAVRNMLTKYNSLVAKFNIIISSGLMSK